MCVLLAVAGGVVKAATTVWWSVSDIYDCPSCGDAVAYQHDRNGAVEQDAIAVCCDPSCRMRSIWSIDDDGYALVAVEAVSIAEHVGYMRRVDCDNCPGYESAAPMMGAPEHYTAQHVSTPPPMPQDRAQAPTRIETEADTFEPACTPWDADDDGRGFE